MTEYVDEIASILERAERSYGGGFSRGSRLPGWERYYAWRLLGWPELANALGKSPGISELQAALVEADRLYRGESRDVLWSKFCAHHVLAGRDRGEGPG